MDYGQEILNGESEAADLDSLRIGEIARCISIHYPHQICCSIACIPRVKTSDKRAKLGSICPPLMLSNVPHSEQNVVLLQSERAQWAASDSQD